jgi:hypothetical protein
MILLCRHLPRWSSGPGIGGAEGHRPGRHCGALAHVWPAKGGPTHHRPEGAGGTGGFWLVGRKRSSARKQEIFQSGVMTSGGAKLAYRAAGRLRFSLTKKSTFVKALGSTMDALIRS